MAKALREKAKEKDNDSAVSSIINFTSLSFPAINVIY